jgi:hypothetical protein
MSGLWKLLLSRDGGVKHKMVIKLAVVLGCKLGGASLSSPFINSPNTM